MPPLVSRRRHRAALLTWAGLTTVAALELIAFARAGNAVGAVLGSVQLVCWPATATVQVLLRRRISRSER